MIQLNKLTFSNWFSYAENNEIELSSRALTQITGVNGAGKSSIPIIIEETLYGKNSKGIKKSDLANRNIPKWVLTSTIEFTKFDKEYIVKLVRGGSTKPTIFCNGEDLSSHTATNTYKTIEKIIGLDFKTFSQLLYQSSTTSLHFLTDTDTQRKNFLIGLFSLDEYTSTHNTLKLTLKDKLSEINELTGSLNTIKSWITEHEKKDLTLLKIQEVPEEETAQLEDSLVENLAILANIDIKNKAINTNNQYKRMLESIDISNTPVIRLKLGSYISEIKEDIELYKEKMADCKYDKKVLIAEIKELESIPENCPTCDQSWPEEKQVNIIDLKKSELEKVESIFKQGLSIQEVLNSHLREYNLEEEQILAHNIKLQEFENLSARIDNTLPDKIYEIIEIDITIKNLKLSIAEDKAIIKKIIASNTKAAAHNATVKVLEEQLKTYREEVVDLQTLLEFEKVKASHLEVLKSAFSTNGLVAYKLEYLVKNLEQEINNYLVEFTGGGFNIQFDLVKDKLNVSILSKSKSVPLTSLSAGELGRVNISTLLAIRKLMSSISNVRINLLFLDEITGVLDDIGKEQLISILLKEDNLNTFIISHDYSHPLVEKIEILKDSDISRIEQ